MNKAIDHSVKCFVYRDEIELGEEKDGVHFHFIVGSDSVRHDVWKDLEGGIKKVFNENINQVRNVIEDIRKG